MKNSLFARDPRSLALALALAFAVPSISRAIPYASTISESGGSVTFYLNETADNVKVVFTGPSSTLDLGARTRGTHNFARGGAASYQIQVTKSTAPTWTQISDDTNNFLKYFAPNGLSVNKNPASTNFGRIYVMEVIAGTTDLPAAGGRTVTEGIYVVNPDISDAFGQGDTARTGGLDTTYDIFSATVTQGSSSDRYDTFQMEVGDDDFVYISDAQDPRGGLFRANADVTSGEIVLFGKGNTTAPTIHTVVYGLHTKGSLASGNLTVWGTDGQWQSTAPNSILRWNINGGALPYNTAPTVVVSAPGPSTERDSDLDVAADGNIFFTVSADGGTGETGVPAVRTYSSTGTLLWSSVIGSVDIFTNAYSLEVSPDNTKLAIIRRDRQTWVVGLTNGPNGRLPDISTTNLLATFTAGSLSHGRSIAWDAAGNLYVANRATERVRIFSPGGTTTATTTSTGTFGITVPANTVSITNTVASISESDATPVVFTVTRTGNTAQPLFVSFLFPGTASNGVDHAAFPTNITFPGGVVSSNISVIMSNDSITEFSETLTVALNSGTNYGVGTPASRTVTILDDETPEISVALAQAEARLLEAYEPSKVGFQISRKGSLTPALTVNLGYAGSAARGSDFNGPLSVALGASAVNASFTITPIDDETYEGDETVLVSVAAGSGYTPVAGSASATVIDDEYPPGTVLFSDSFESDTSANWIINTNSATGDAAAQFGYDYSQRYVPAVPGSGTTKGLLLRLNEQAGAQPAAISASPLSINLPADYRLRFKMWINYFGPLDNHGGPGSTLHVTTGVGTTPDHANLATSAASDGIWFGIDGDGGSTTAIGDCDAYLVTDLQADASGVYAAGTTAPRNTSSAFYSLWGGVAAPAAQLANYPTQTGSADPGNMGFAWHTVAITKSGTTVTWAIDGVTIAIVPSDSVTLGTNVFVGFSDLFAGTVATPAVSFALIENLRVETFATTPINITSIKIVGGNVEVYFSGPTTAAATEFKLQKSLLVGGTYTDDNSANITEIGSGQGTFKAVTTVSGGGTQFYRIKR